MAIAAESLFPGKFENSWVKKETVIKKGNNSLAGETKQLVKRPAGDLRYWFIIHQSSG